MFLRRTCLCVQCTLPAANQDLWLNTDNWKFEHKNLFPNDFESRSSRELDALNWFAAAKLIFNELLYRQRLVCFSSPRLFNWISSSSYEQYIVEYSMNIFASMSGFPRRRRPVQMLIVSSNICLWTGLRVSAWEALMNAQWALLNDILNWLAIDRFVGTISGD